MDTELLEAAREGNLDKVRELVSQGASIHAEGSFAVHDGTLCTAVNSGHLGAVKYLVGQGSDPHANEDIALH